MAIIDFTNVVKLKKTVENEFGENIHFHDACGGQYFTLENTSTELQKFITSYLKKLGYNTKFDKNGLSFTLKD